MYYYGTVQLGGGRMITVNHNGIKPIHEQIKDRIEMQILNGVMEKGEFLPSVRELACSLAINPNTVQKAYSALEAEGVTMSVSGRGRIVSVDSSELKKIKVKDELKNLEASVKKLMEYGFSAEDMCSFIKEMKK